MCTSVVVNRKKTIVGWNLDLLGMAHRVRESEEGVFIEVPDETEGWLPLFGANARGDFVGMPTCWPFDGRSDPREGAESILLLDIDLLLQKKTFAEVLDAVSKKPVCSVPGATFMGALSDENGNVLHVVPGQGYQYYEKPDHAILTNFSPFKGETELHPWMGLDRYRKAEAFLKTAESFDAGDCLRLLKEVSQEVCPTVVSMVYDVGARTVYWCENRDWARVSVKRFGRRKDGENGNSKTAS